MMFVLTPGDDTLRIIRKPFLFMSSLSIKITKKSIIGFRILLKMKMFWLKADMMFVDNIVLEN